MFDIIIKEIEKTHEGKSEREILYTILKLLKRPKVCQVLIAIIHNQKFIIMNPLVLSNGNQAPIVPGLVDAATLDPIPGATFVSKSNTVDNAAVATVDANGNLVAVAVGSGNLTSVNTWTYVDQNTQQSVTEDLTTVVPFQVIATAEGVLQVVSLGTPVPIAPVTPVPVTP